MQRVTRFSGLVRCPRLTQKSSSLSLIRSTFSPLCRFSTGVPSTPLSHSGLSVPSPTSSESDPDVDPERAYGYGSTDTLFEDVQIDSTKVADPTNRTFTYLVAGSAAFMYASFGRLAVNKFVNYLTATADVMALASMEVDISSIAEGTATTVKWRGKPVFIRHRTAKEIELAKADDAVSLRDPETDAERFPEHSQYAVLIGVCTHLGCVPINGAGDYGGWFCPCHGSHYDTSGRIRKGPAPLNLVVPQYKFLTDTKVQLG